MALQGQRLSRRQRRRPKPRATHPAEGDVSLAYFDSDGIKSITQGASQTTYSLDSAARRWTQTTTEGTTLVSNVQRHYVDESDNPAWSVETTPQGTITTRYLELINGDLGLTLTTTSAGTVAELALSSLRGDVAATVELPADPADPAVGIGSWSEYTEYGTPKQAVDTSAGGVTDRVRLAWYQAAGHDRCRVHPDGSPPLQPHHRPVHQPRPPIPRRRHLVRLPQRPHQPHRPQRKPVVSRGGVDTRCRHRGGLYSGGPTRLRSCGGSLRSLESWFPHCGQQKGSKKVEYPGYDLNGGRLCLDRTFAIAGVEGWARVGCCAA